MSQNGNTNERFYKSENRLFHADTVTNKSTGEVVEISNSLEKLYTYMLNQYRYRKGLKQPFAESQERLGTIARIGDPKKKTKLQIDKLIALGLVEITGNIGRCNIYTVTEVDKVAENLEFTYTEYMDEPTYDHEKRLGKANQKPTNEEKKGDDESDQGGAGKRDGVPPVGVSVDADVPANDDSSLNDQPDKGSNDNGRPAWFRAPFKGNGDLVPEAKAWARLRGATSEEEEKHEIWRALEIINPLLDSQSKPEPQPSDPSTAADEEETEEEEESEEYPF
ncbi:hypothetical protein I5L30_16380 [Serratia marcescens]|nr:hypothetical protein [Serratia marcescens]MBH2941357.1 hypothetical protein [Serratia marcescens]